VLPDRIVRSDVVVLGRVVALEPKDVETTQSAESPYWLDYRIAVVKVIEVIHGPKDLKAIRLGFVSPDEDLKVDKRGKPLPSSLRGVAAPLEPPAKMVPFSTLHFQPFKVGQEGLFFLQKHHQGTFYVNFVISGGVEPGDAPDFAKKLEKARLLGKILDRPLEALKAENASNRFLAAAMLLDRYRPHTLKDAILPTKAIDAEESKLLLKALAEADWQDVNEAISSSKYPRHPFQLFLRLGVTKADGYDPPGNATGFRTRLAYAQQWLRDNQEKYRIQRFSSSK
jgi:hypothetical protein